MVCVKILCWRFTWKLEYCCFSSATWFGQICCLPVNPAFSNRYPGVPVLWGMVDTKSELMLTRGSAVIRALLIGAEDCLSHKNIGVGQNSYTAFSLVKIRRISVCLTDTCICLTELTSTKCILCISKYFSNNYSLIFDLKHVKNQPLGCWPYCRGMETLVHFSCVLRSAW